MSSVWSEMPVSLPPASRSDRAGRSRSGLGAGRCDLDPAVAVAERYVDALLGAQCLGVELERTILAATGTMTLASLLTRGVMALLPDRVDIAHDRRCRRNSSVGD